MRVQTLFFGSAFGLAVGSNEKEPAPRFSATTTTGEKFTNRTIQGKVALFEFWTTWCGYCADEAAPSGPEFKQSYLALDGPIGELFAGRRGGGKTRGGFLFVGADGETEGAAEENSLHAHGRNVAHIVEQGSGDGGIKTGE